MTSARNTASEASASSTDPVTIPPNSPAVSYTHLSSVRYGLSDLTPSVEILGLYHDLGGRILTIGSDSHKPEHLGAHIPMMRERLQEIGFTEFCTFDHMEPIFHRL